MREVTKENLTVQIDRLRKVKDEQGQLSMSGEYTLQAYEMLLAMMETEPEPVVREVLEHLRSIVADPRLLPRRKEWISGQQYSYVLLEEVEAIVEHACRAAMLNQK